MTSIKLLSDIIKPTIDNFVMPKCQLSGCNCDIRLSYPNSSRVDSHRNIDDILVVGTKEECRNGTKDIIQSVADGFIELGWATPFNT